MYRSTAFEMQIENLNVVVVEDSRPMQEVLRSILSSLRVERIRVFSNADEALKSMSMDPPTLIISDWQMKPLSGHNMLKIIRHKSMAPLCFVPVLMISGHATHTIVDKAFRAGAHQFLVKPISPTAVFQRLGMILNDERRFVLENDHYVISGVNEELDKAAGNSSLARQRHLEKLVAFRELRAEEKRAEKQATKESPMQDVLNEAERRRMNAQNYRGGAPKKNTKAARPELPERVKTKALRKPIEIEEPIEHFREL